MQLNSSSTIFHWAFALIAALVVTSWWLTVPEVMATSTFAALCGILAASVWVVMSTYQNARPASSLAQSLHDVDAPEALKRTNRNSGAY